MAMADGMDEEPCDAARLCTASLLDMPHEVMAGIAWCLGVKDVGHVAAACKINQQEATDFELWFHLFMRTCWPPSSALLAFAEEGSKNPAAVNWRTRLETRAKTLPAIVVDVGRGYTKYTVVHSIHGRSEPEGEAPRIVQLCSSPTHPPDCGRDDQLSFIHCQLDRLLAAAALHPADPLHLAAVMNVKPVEGGKALVKESEKHPDLCGRMIKLINCDPTADIWEAEIFDPTSQRRGSRMSLRRESNIVQVEKSSVVPIRSSGDLPLLLGEPFVVTASRLHGGGDINSSTWAHGISREIHGRSGPVRIAPQAQMSLWAFGIDHGIVVNIGQGQTVAIPVVNGEVVGNATCHSELGSGRLTMAMLNILGSRFPFIDSGLMTWCRDVKEQYCYVAPPAPPGTRTRSLRARLAAGDDFGVQHCEIPNPLGQNQPPLSIGEERVLVPELFFDAAMGVRPTLPEIIIGCAEKVCQLGLCDQDGIRKLMQQVVLVGGAADIPGIRPRTEHELRAILREREGCGLASQLKSPDDVYVLNPPRGDDGPLASPRFVPLIGGCVRAASSLHFESPSEAEDNQVGRRHSVALTAMPHPLFNGSLDSAPGFAAWMRRRLGNLDGPAIFRTGGGGGEDDDAWQFMNDVDVDDEEEDPDEDEDVDSSDKDEDCEEELDEEITEEREHADDNEVSSPSRMGPRSGQARELAITTAAAQDDIDDDEDDVVDEEAAPTGAGQRSQPDPQAGKGKGMKGNGKGRKGKGRGKDQRVWRPVQR